MHIRYLFIVVCALFAALGMAHAQGTAKPKTTLDAEILQQFPIQFNGAITPQNAQQVTQDMVASFQQAPAVNSQALTTYTVQLTDYGQLLQFTNAGAVAVSLSSASSSGFFPFSFYAQAVGAGGVTITPMAGTIAGSSSYSLAQNSSVQIISDGTNWQVLAAVGSAGSGCTVTGVSHGYVYNNGSSGCSTSSNFVEASGVDTENAILNIVNNGDFEVAGNAMTFPGSAATIAALTLADQTVSGGANVTSNNLGTLTSGTTTIDCGKTPLQYFTDNGVFTLAAPANDGSCVLLMTNGASAAAPTFTGFTVGSNVGDAYATTSGNKYFLSIGCINAVCTYFRKALQ